MPLGHGTVRKKMLTMQGHTEDFQHGNNAKRNVLACLCTARSPTHSLHLYGGVQRKFSGRFQVAVVEISQLVVYLIWAFLLT